MSILTPDEVDQYKQTGYVIQTNFFDADETRAMQMELNRLQAENLGKDVMPLPHLQNIHFSPLDDKSDLFRALPFKEEIVKAVAQLIGDPVLLWLDQIFLKPARIGVGNTWHEDNARFKIADVRRGVGMWIALHDSTRANGTLELIPRSFLQSRLLDTFRLPNAEQEARATAAEMPAGGAVFFNFGMLHCTRDNQSTTPRAAAIYHFLQADHRPAAPYLSFGRNIPLSGPQASGGQREYGQLVAGSWRDRIAAVLSA